MATKTLVLRNFSKLVLQPRSICIISTAGVKNYKPIPKKEIDPPPFEEGRKWRLPIMEKRPVQVQGGLPEYMPRNKREYEGPELVHNTLLHKQYGIQAQSIGLLLPGHFEMMRNNINRNMDTSRVFAVYRVPAPWMPLYKKPAGKRMGQGRSKPWKWCTPIREERVIVEIGGHTDLEQIEYWLTRVAEKLPFPAKVVTHEQMEAEKAEVAQKEATNINMFTFKHCLLNNLTGVQKHAKRVDYKYFGKYNNYDKKMKIPM